MTARAFYRSYVDGTRRGGQVRRVHIERLAPKEPRRVREGRAPMSESGRQAWCGTHTWGVTRSEPVWLNPIPAVLSEGLSWCANCLGHYAEEMGRLAEIGALLVAPSGAPDTSLYLRSAGPRDEGFGFDLEPGVGLAALLTEGFKSILDLAGENFAELIFKDETGTRYAATFMRPGGQTPSQMLTAANKELVQLRTELAVLRTGTIPTTAQEG